MAGLVTTAAHSAARARVARAGQSAFAPGQRDRPRDSVTVPGTARPSPDSATGCTLLITGRLIQ